MFCTQCGFQFHPVQVFCSGCGFQLPSSSEANPNLPSNQTFRQDFALTFALAALTGIFWISQMIYGEPGYSLFAPISGLLSLFARAAFIVSFAAKSKNWLAISAISSTSSIGFAIVGTAPFGFNAIFQWPTALTILFSIATLISYVLQARNAGVRPYVVTRNT
jgi:hypothetical protein